MELKAQMESIGLSDVYQKFQENQIGFDELCLGNSKELDELFAEMGLSDKVDADRLKYIILQHKKNAEDKISEALLKLVNNVSLAQQQFSELTLRLDKIDSKLGKVKLNLDSKHKTQFSAKLNSNKSKKIF